MVITFTKLRGLSTSEKSCGFDSSYEVHIKYPGDFTVAFLMNNNTVSHVPQQISSLSCSYFLQKSGREITSIVNVGSVSTSSGGNKNTLTDCFVH